MIMSDVCYKWCEAFSVRILVNLWIFDPGNLTTLCCWSYVSDWGTVATKSMEWGAWCGESGNPLGEVSYLPMMLLKWSGQSGTLWVDSGIWCRNSDNPVNGEMYSLRGFLQILGHSGIMLKSNMSWISLKTSQH